MNADEITPEILEKEAAEKAGLMVAIDLISRRVREIDATAAAWRVRKLAALSAKHAEQDERAARVAARRANPIKAPPHWLDAHEERAERPELEQEAAL